MHFRSPANTVGVRTAPAATMVGLLLAACAGVTPATSPAPTSAPATVPSAEPTRTEAPTASPSATATASSGPTALEVNWTVDFVVTGAADWSTEDVHETLGGITTADTLWIAAGQRFVAVTRTGPDTVQAWLDKVAATEQLDATEPVEVELGGVPGYRVDLVVSDLASEARCVNKGRCYTLFQDSSGYWPVVEGRPTALWIVDVGGETLAIATDSRENSFTEWVATAEDALATIEWR